MLVYKVCQKVKKRCAEGKKLKVKAYTKPLLEDAKCDLDLLRKVLIKNFFGLSQCRLKLFDYSLNYIRYCSIASISLKSFALATAKFNLKQRDWLGINGAVKLAHNISFVSIVTATCSCFEFWLVHKVVCFLFWLARVIICYILGWGR